MDSIKILINPAISAGQLYAFYQRNDICEAGYGKDVASRVLERSSLIIAAFRKKTLVGIARAMFDGLDAYIAEFSLDLEFQGDDLRYENGSLIENDPAGLGKRMAGVLINELRRMGAFFISTYVVENCSERFYESLGFRRNTGHLVYIIDERPYVNRDKPLAAEN